MGQMRIKETIQADEVGRLEDILPELGDHQTKMCDGKCDVCLFAADCDPPCICLICDNNTKCEDKPRFSCEKFVIQKVK